MHTTKEEFDQFIRDVCKELKALKYEDDPHVVMVFGNHDEQTQMSMSCYPFRIAAARIIENAANNAEGGLHLGLKRFN